MSLALSHPQLSLLLFWSWTSSFEQILLFLFRWKQLMLSVPGRGSPIQMTLLPPSLPSLQILLIYWRKDWFLFLVFVTVKCSATDLCKAAALLSLRHYCASARTLKESMWATQGLPYSVITPVLFLGGEFASCTCCLLVDLVLQWLSQLVKLEVFTTWCSL